MTSFFKFPAAAIFLVAAASCGGGGGGAAPVSPGSSSATGDTAVTGSTSQNNPAPAATPTPVVTPRVAAAPRDIAWWGDSLTQICASSLQQAFPDRTVFNGGVSGQTSAQILERVKADADHRGWINLFWYGHNDYYKDDTRANIDESVKWLQGNPEFVVLSMLTWSGTGYRGTTEYTETLRVNSGFAASYPDNYLDIRTYLVGLYDPSSPQDVQDHANDLVPTSLRFDTIHLNASGCQAVAAKIKEVITSKGW